MSPRAEPFSMRKRLQSFRYAFAGIVYTLRTQHNAWIHSLISAAVLALGLWLGLRPIDWALIIVAGALVWSLEVANTAVEALVDLVSPEPHPLARIAKDAAAGAVLIAACAAALVGLLVLGPPLWARVAPWLGL